MERNLRNVAKSFNRLADYQTFVQAIPKREHSINSLNTHRQELVRLREVFLLLLRRRQIYSIFRTGVIPRWVG